MKKKILLAICAPATLAATIAPLTACKPSEPSEPARFVISANISNGQLSGETEIKEGETVTLTLVAATHHKLPSSITVTGCQYEYDQTSGVITLSNPTANINVSATCVEFSYSITKTTTFGSFVGDDYMFDDETKNLTFNPLPGYGLPNSVTVTNAESSYNKETGVVTITNPTGDIEVVANGAVVTYQITNHVLNGSIAGDTTIDSGETIQLQLNPTKGFVYPADSEIEVFNASYKYDKSTGKITISNPLNKVTVFVSCTGDNFTIQNKIEHATIVEEEQSIHGGEMKFFHINYDPGYDPLTEIQVQNAEYEYFVDGQQGTLILKNPIGNVVLDGDKPQAHHFSITVNGTDCTYTGVSEYITVESEPQTITIAPNTDHLMPGDVTVTGASYRVDEENKTISINNPTQDVVIDVVCPTISELFDWDTPVGSDISINKYTGNKALVDIPDTVTINNAEYTITGIDANAFRDNETIKEVTVPTGVTVIEEGTFCNCRQLESFTPKSTITEFKGGRDGNGCFQNCASLKAISWGEGTHTIGYHSFHGCSQLTIPSFPTTLTAINWSAFQGCASIKSLTIPSSITTLQDSVFNGCTGLESAVVENGRYFLPISLFQNCSGLKSVTLPNNLGIISQYCFKGCTSLTEINLPDTLSTTSGNIGLQKECFYNCTSLSTINYAGNISKFGSVVKGENWAGNIPATVVHCNDGDWNFPE